MNLERFRGLGAFGRAYQTMMERDAHAPSSVDRVLASTMVRLCNDTAAYLYSSFTPLEVQYSQGSRPRLEAALNSACPDRSDPEACLSQIAAFTSGLSSGAEQDLKKVRVGGLEEEIIERRSDWCTDVARVACMLCQVAGFPCRIVNLFNLHQAYSAHVIIEAHRAGCWGALDSSTGVLYRHPDQRPASVWQLMNDPDLLDRHREATGGFYTTRDQFSAAGIANYFVWENEKHDYTVTGVNEYYSSILSMSEKGWPGGLRWLFGEDEDGGERSPPADPEGRVDAPSAAAKA